MRLFYSFCGGKLNSDHNSETGSPVAAPILGRLFTFDVRTGDPIKFPTRFQNGANDPAAAIGFSGVNSDPYIEAHHTPGFNLRYEQLSDSELCPEVSKGKIGKYTE